MINPTTNTTVITTTANPPGPPTASNGVRVFRGDCDIEVDDSDVDTAVLVTTSGKREELNDDS